MESPDLDTDEVNLLSEKSKLKRKRSDSPAPSCVSMNTADMSMDPLTHYKDGNSSSVNRIDPVTVEPEGSDEQSSDEQSIYQKTHTEHERNQLQDSENRQQHSEVSEVFIPEIVKDRAASGAYRFLCSYAGQFHCKFTNLVFVMKGSGEVLYRVLHWDNSKLQVLSQFQPAGPCYNIECPEDSLLKLYLPHCEIHNDINQIDLRVAHFTDGNVELMQPLKITSTHVIIEIQSLSIFSLVKNWHFPERPIKGQILLFYKEFIGQKMRRKLRIHLLPENVPVEEVQKQHQDSTYIKCSSICELIPNKKYRPHCEPYVYQPKINLFFCDYGPNYHFAFEVMINVDVEDLTLGLLDENDQQVWGPCQIYLTVDSREAGPVKRDKGAEFVDTHMNKLIQRVSSAMEIADTLITKKVISEEAYSNIYKASTTQDKMRMLYMYLDSGGKSELYKILREKEPLIVDDLESTSSKA